MLPACLPEKAEPLSLMRPWARRATLPPSQVVVQVARKPLHVGAGDFTYNSPQTWGALGGPAGAASTPSYKEVTVTARVINGRKLYNSLNLFLLPRDLFLKVNR